MAKKTKKRTNKAAQNTVHDNMLPQNILPIGERVEGNKNIYISQQVYKEIHKFTQNKTTNESGGMLVGTVIEEFGKTNIIISGFVEAKYAEGTPTTLKFTHETWNYVHKEIDKKHNGKKIVGWIHTHPDFGIFLSEYDKFIQQNFFSEDYQIAYVVDPIQDIEGFYSWNNGNIEKCKGFYIYDKTGVSITVEIDKEETKMTEKSTFNKKNVIIAILSVTVLFLIFSQVSTNNKLKEIQEQQEIIMSSETQSWAYMQQLITAQNAEIEALKEQINGETADDTSNTENVTPPIAEDGSETADTSEDEASSDNSHANNSDQVDEAVDETTDDSNVTQGGTSE